MKIGTRLYTYFEKCEFCSDKKMIDINGECKDCFDGNQRNEVEK